MAAPFISGIGEGPWGVSDPKLAQAVDVLRWMRSYWEHRENLLPAPATGVAGHSYGAMLAARVAAFEPVSAYASLSAGWHEWISFSDLPLPLEDLSVPSLHIWGGSSDFTAVLEGNMQHIWDAIPTPKHKVVLHDADHWSYLQASGSPCAASAGGCHLSGAIASDLVATFFAKRLPPSEGTLVGVTIPNSLIPPAVPLTLDQEFYAGSHLMGLKMLPFSEGCSVTSAWETTGGSEGSVTLSSP